MHHSSSLLSSSDQSRALSSFFLSGFSKYQSGTEKKEKKKSACASPLQLIKKNAISEWISNL